MRYTSLVLTSLLAASHVCHGKPLPTPDDPPHSESYPTEAESISITFVDTATLAEKTIYPVLYPIGIEEDFPSMSAEITIATIAVPSMSAEITIATIAVESVTVSATASEVKSAEVPAATTSEEHAAPFDHEASLDDEAAPPIYDTLLEYEASSDHDTSSNHGASSDHDASSEAADSSDDEPSSDDEATPVDSSPKPQDQDRPCGRFDPWTIHSLSRRCDDADTVCNWSFIIDTNCPSLAPTPCLFSIKALGPDVPASRSPKHEKSEDELCGPYEVHSSWSGQFGPGEGFTTLSVIDGGNKLVAYPAYRDDLFGKENATVPDVEVAVYALG